jgi:hypothetical protein
MQANHTRRHRAPAVALALLIGLAATGCNNLLDVTNPAFISEEQLTDPALEQLVVNGVVGEFQYAYGYYALFSSAMTDESFLDHTQVDIRELTLRNILESNTVNAAIYSNLHRARQSAEDGIDRLTAMLGESDAAKSVSMATIMAYGAYAYTLLGEGFCESTVNASAPLTSDQMLQKGIDLFDRAISTAQAAGSSAEATDIVNMARVGAARAALKMGDATKAASYASQVPAGYEKYVWYSANSVRENNIFQVPAGTSGSWMSMGPAFQTLDDPRAPKTTRTDIRGLNSNPIFPPQQPIMFQGWSATAVDNQIENATSIKFATGLEAQYVVAEAQGPTAATLTFVNARRAVGGKAPVNLSGNDLMEELRWQRAIDLYLTGQRLGDLRRYKSKLGIDLFPSGKFPVSNEVYSDATCFVIPTAEKNANPNFR